MKIKEQTEILIIIMLKSMKARKWINIKILYVDKFVKCNTLKCYITDLQTDHDNLQINNWYE
jgi:hypothetical protein